MVTKLLARVALFILFLFSFPGVYSYSPPWLNLPPTPSLPPATATGTIPVTQGAKIWYSFFGEPLSDTLAANKTPVVFLHGGLGNSNYFGLQISDLLDLNVAMLSIDTRGHGRSTDGQGPLTYDKFTQDLITILDSFKIPKVAIIGWSDGGIIGLDVAMNYSSRLDRLFCFGGSYDPANLQPDIGNSAVFNEYVIRTETEYKALNPYPDHYSIFLDKMNTMWATLPKWNAASFATIPILFNSLTAPLIWIADGDHEEAITFETPRQMTQWIPGSSMNILPEVSHFAFLQYRAPFSYMVRQFLTRSK
jgi:pimeloyl-ACP methyl ester carboxylesterase